jgi:tetratricopeptide (TPR) repeat protein
MNPAINTFSELDIYPDLIWISGWEFGFDPLSGPSQTLHNGPVFQTLPEKGSIAGSDPETWHLHFRLPLKARLQYFSNGLIVKRRKTLAVIAAPAPNVLCGLIPKRYAIELQCEHNHLGENTHFRTDNGVGTLLRRETAGNIYFSLVIDAPSQEAAERLALEHFTHTPHELIQLHPSRRKLIQHLDLFSNANILPALAGESLIKQLRTPEGAFGEIWPASPAMDNSAFSLNEIYPLIIAWSDIDPDQALKIYTMALSQQRDDGHFPAWVAPNGDRNSFDAPQLFFAQCAELLSKKAGERGLVKKQLTALNKYIRWSLRHYFPQSAIHPSAQSPQETLAPESWTKNCATVEHTTLLICELEALIRLHTQVASPIPIFIEQAHEKLTELIDKEFWNPQTRSYANTYQSEEKCTRRGLHEYLPLLWENLPSEKRRLLLTQFKQSPWATSRQPDPLTGEATSPATPLQQLIILQCVKHKKNSHTHTGAHVRRVWSDLMAWQQRHFHRKVTTPMPVIDTAFICLLIDLQAQRMQYIRQAKRWMKIARTLIHKLKLNRDDLIIIFSFTFLMLGTRTLYKTRVENLSTVTLQQAYASYTKNDAQNTFTTCAILLKKDPQNKEARLLLANTLLMNDRPAEAQKHYQILNALDPDNPAFLIGLAMAKHRQKNSPDVQRHYQEFQAYFAPYFPQTSQLVNRMQNLDTDKLTRYFIQRIIQSEFMLTL